MRYLILILTIAEACASQRTGPEQAAFGNWRVTGSICPTECAMTRGEADGWRGRTATYENSWMRFADNSCTGPQYSVGHWTAAGLYGGARLWEIGVAEDSVLVIEVRCPAQPQVGSDPRWQAPGSFLVVKDRDHLLAVWEGVFFELTRQWGELPIA